jgi:hypothetical protein
VLERLVTLESGGIEIRRHLLDRPLQGEIDAHRRRLGALALGLHRRLKPIEIHREAVLLGNLLGDRETPQRARRLRLHLR